MGVGVGRDRDAGVPEALLDHLQVSSALQQRGGMKVPQAVKPDMAHTNTTGELLEIPRKRGWVKRLSERPREYKPMISPDITEPNLKQHLPTSMFS